MTFVHPLPRLVKKDTINLTKILLLILGYQCNDTAINDLSSFECPEHKFCDGINSPQDCPPTFYCPQGSSEGIPCPPGFFCLGGTNGKTSCSKGNYCPGGEDSERPCPPGYKCQVAEMYLPEPCQPGTYLPGRLGQDRKIVKLVLITNSAQLQLLNNFQMHTI